MQISEPGQRQYGVGDTSFVAAGGEAGISRLVNDFYDQMEQLPEAAAIRALHPGDLSESRDKLSRFLSGWLGGPKRYSEKYGPINIPATHAHLAIGSAERDAWLLCMRRALERQPWADDFKDYLIRALGVPAERCRNRE